MRQGGSQEQRAVVNGEVSHRVCCDGGRWLGWRQGWEVMKKTMKNQRKPPTPPDRLY